MSFRGRGYLLNTVILLTSVRKYSKRCDSSDQSISRICRDNICGSDHRCAILMYGDSPKSDNGLSPDTPDVDTDGHLIKISGPNGTLYADFASTNAAKDLIGSLKDSPINVDLQDYGSFEKVGNIGINLSRSDRDMDTGPGDIMLYNGNSIVIFYGNNSWDYTPLARIPDATAESMKAFLGNGDVSLVLSVEEKAVA